MVVHLKGLVLLVLAGMLGVGCTSNGEASTGGDSTTQEPPDTQIVAAEPPTGPEVWDSGPQDPLSQADVDAIKEAVQKAAESYRGGQFQSFSNKFTNDGKLMPPNSQPRNGKQAIKAFAELSPKIDTLTVTNIAVDGAGKRATVNATVEMTGKTNDPVNENALTIGVSSKGTLLITMKKKSGTWLAKDVAYVPQ